MDVDPDTIKLVRGNSRTTTSVGTVAQRKREGQARRCRLSIYRAAASGLGQLVQYGRWNRGDRSTESAKIRILVGALAALGPEDTSAKTEIEAALKRAKAQESAPARVARQSGEVGTSHCRHGELSRTRAGCVLVVALKKAQKESQELPLEAQILAREGFIERANTFAPGRHCQANRG